MTYRGISSNWLLKKTFYSHCEALFAEACPSGQAGNLLCGQKSKMRLLRFARNDRSPGVFRPLERITLTLNSFPNYSSCET